MKKLTVSLMMLSQLAVQSVALGQGCETHPVLGSVKALGSVILLKNSYDKFEKLKDREKSENLIWFIKENKLNYNKKEISAALLKEHLAMDDAIKLNLNHIMSRLKLNKKYEKVKSVLELPIEAVLELPTEQEWETFVGNQSKSMKGFYFGDEKLIKKIQKEAQKEFNAIFKEKTAFGKSSESKLMDRLKVAAESREGLLEILTSPSFLVMSGISIYLAADAARDIFSGDCADWSRRHASDARQKQLDFASVFEPPTTREVVTSPAK